MGQLTPLLTGKLVAFDTGPLIYYIEEHPEYLSAADELFGAFDSGASKGMTSVLTLQEVLVKPLREGMRILPKNTGKCFQTRLT
jgi:predicted nucleic acid-binding protein